MRIVPIISQFNPNRIFCKIGKTSIYADKGNGVVEVIGKELISLKGMRNIGLRTDAGTLGEITPRIIIKDSSIACIYGNENHRVFLQNCTFPEVKAKKPKYEHVAQIVYTNRI